MKSVSKHYERYLDRLDSGDLAFFDGLLSGQELQMQEYIRGHYPSLACLWN